MRLNFWALIFINAFVTNLLGANGFITSSKSVQNVRSFRGTQRLFSQESSNNESSPVESFLSDIHAFGKPFRVVVRFAETFDLI